MYARILVAILVSIGLTAPSTSHADLIDPSGIGANFFAYPSLNASTVSYDATTDIFSMTQTLTAAFPYTFFDSYELATATTVANDFVGSFARTATIDGSGTFSGGSFSLVGGSTVLGIAAGTTVLSGTLNLFINGLQTAYSGIQFLSNPTVVDPLLVAAVGPINTLLIGQCCMSNNDFSSSFGPVDTASSGPELWGTANRIPEPTTLAMMALGLAGLGFVMRRRQAA